MADYNFETLNSIDFEYLVRDLLNAKFKAEGSTIQFQSFPAGKDRGIDLLDSASEKDNYNCIVQVKHQPNTHYDLFVSHLYKSTRTHVSEIEKIKKLSPNKYILATSKALTLVNREDIWEKMKPYIRSTQDIFDRERLNQLLTQFPEVETAHPKLWFSSVAVFNKIFHNDLYQRSKLLQSDVLEKFKLYVSVYSVDKAVSILENTQFLVITGEPGCGKTTFAEMVLHRLIALDFTSYWIDKSVTEVEKLLLDDDSKQIFYFDDFLGHTRYEIEISKSQEKGLLHFLRNLRQRTNKYFILTTRTALINEAATESERFRRSGVFQEKQEIKVKTLTDEVKLRMIKNHLVVKNVPTEYAHQLSEKRLLEIVRHTNFSPRIIEFVTTTDNYETISAEEYFTYILKQLDNPHEVWLHAYEQQLTDSDRFLLTTLYSFRSAINESIMERAFEQRLEYEISVNRIPRTINAFNNSLKKLLGSFVAIKKFYAEERLDFINPSIEDFLNHYLKDKEVEKLRIVNSFIYLEQIYSRFRISGEGYMNVKPGKAFSDRIANVKLDTIADVDGKSKPSYILIYSAILNHMFLRGPKDVTITLQFLRNVKWNQLSAVNEFHLLSFLKAAALTKDLKKYVLTTFHEVIIAQFNCCKTVDHLINVKDLFGIYGESYVDFISTKSIYKSLKRFIDNFFEDELADLSENLRETATDVDAVHFECERMKSEIAGIYKQMEITDDVKLRFFDLNWEAICTSNLFTEEMERDDKARGPIRLDPDD